MYDAVSWSTIAKIAVACFLFVALILVAAYLAEWVNSDLEVRKAQAEEQLGYAEFDVLIGSRNTGDAIYGVLRIKDEDIPKFFEGHTWSLLPPPPPEE